MIFSVRRFLFVSQRNIPYIRGQNRELLNPLQGALMKIRLLTVGLATMILSVCDLGGAPAEWTLEAIRGNAVLAADWMNANPKKHSHLDWTYGAYYSGVTALGLSDPSLPYLDQIRKLGTDNAWGHLPRTYHADDHCIGQSWLEIAAFDNNPVPAERLRLCFDYIMANPHTGSLDFTKRGNQNRWSWCDALFMSPTVFTKMAGFTGEKRYLEFMDREFKATYDLLYSREHHLYYRDSRFIDQKTANGQSVFWCRGNGWVYGGLAIMLRDLPPDWPTRPFYEKNFREMSAALKKAQHADGAWRPSLLDLQDPDLPEMSGTCFFTFGMLWGINSGLLDEAEYLPCVKKSWAVICKNINAEGRLGWVQPIGDRPKSYTAEDHEVYAVGAFLNAAVELKEYVVRHSSPGYKTLTVANPLSVYRAAETITVDIAAQGLKAEGLRIFDTRDNAFIPWQSLADGRVIFRTYMLAGQSRQFLLINNGALPEAHAPLICFSRHFPERMDDFGWENDRIAARVYGPAVMQPAPKGEGLVSSGIDVWNKKVRHPIMEKFIKQGKYHQDHGEGMDNYKVGAGRGCGGFGVYTGGKFYHSRNWAEQRHIDNGPVRTEFELTYAAWDCGGGMKVSEKRRISLDAGSHMTRFESTFTIEGGVALTGGPGVDIARDRAHNGIITLKPDEGWIANYEPEQRGAGRIGTAIVIPGKAAVAMDAIECLYLLHEIKTGEPVVWYAGSCWSGAGDFVSAESWSGYVAAFAQALAHPLKIEIQ